MKFLVDNWAQFSFLLLAIGYVIKVILDSLFKRKEIKYNYFLNNRMKSIEQFLSAYSNLQSTYSDTSTSYLNKLLTAEETDNIILPLRYKFQDALAMLQLYVTKDEYAKFSEVFSNFVFLMNQVRRLKWVPGISDVEKGNELSSLIRKGEIQNQDLLKEIIAKIQKDIIG